PRGALLWRGLGRGNATEEPERRLPPDPRHRRAPRGPVVGIAMRSDRLGARFLANVLRPTLVLASLSLLVPSPSRAGWQTFRTQDGLSSNDVLALLEDRAGNFWFGTFGHGVN